MTATATNIKQHLKVLRQEYSRLMARKLNNLVITDEESKNYCQHYQYVKKLVLQEHFKQACKGLTKS